MLHRSHPAAKWPSGLLQCLLSVSPSFALGRELFDTLLEARVLIERWRRHYNTVRPHSSPGLLTPGSRSDPAPLARFGYASASQRGWPGGYPNTNLETGSLSGDRS